MENNMENNKVARIVKIENLINSNTIYIVEGELMKRLLENVFDTKQPVFTASPILTKDFITMFKQGFLHSLDDNGVPANKYNSDMKMLTKVMTDANITTYESKIEYLDKVINKSVFLELIDAARKLKEIEVNNQKGTSCLES
jgi:hypothetical protein